MAPQVAPDQVRGRLFPKNALSCRRRRSKDLEPRGALELVLGDAIVVRVHDVLPGLVVAAGPDSRLPAGGPPVSRMLDEQDFRRPPPLRRPQGGPSLTGPGPAPLEFNKAA